MKALLIAATLPIIAVNFYLAGNQLENLVHAVVGGKPTGWILFKVFLGIAFPMTILVKVMITLDRIRLQKPSK